MNITPASKLVEQALEEIKEITPRQAEKLRHQSEVIICDIRDVRELWQNGKISGARHTPRGMLEFWADPQSPYHKDFFSSAKTIILYCAMSWRSALAAKTLQDMGFNNICHIKGGYAAWLDEELPVDEVVKS